MLILIDNYDSFTYNLVHYFEEIGQKVTVLQKFCDDLKAKSNCKMFFGGNIDLLRLVNTHGKVFYSLNEFDKFFKSRFLN